MRNTSAKFWWILGSSLTFLVLLTGSFFVFNSFYTAHAAPRTSMAGQSVTGDTRQELTARLQSTVDALTVDLTVDGEKQTVTLADLGYTIDVEKTIDQVFESSETVSSRATSLFKSTDVTPVFSVDSAVAEKFATDLVEKVGSPATDATVTLDETSGVFSATKSSAGKEVDISALTASAERAIATLTSQSIDLTTTEVEPAVTTAAAKAVADAANAIVALPVTVSGEITSHEATAAEKASWIKLSSADGELAEPTLDAKAVETWVKATGESTNDAPIEGVRNVNSRGDVVSVVSEAVAGWEVTNTSEIAEELVQSLTEDKAFDGKFTYKEVTTEKWEDRQIADGAEDLAYQATKGEKWIDVNLSNYTMTAYEGATVVQGPISMVSGAEATPTIVGTFKVYSKLESQTMRGDNADGTKYETENVPDILYFSGGYALHGAYWRSSFGYAGSHGCINLPLDAAATLFSWAEIGTVVVTHY